MKIITYPLLIASLLIPALAFAASASADTSIPTQSITMSISRGVPLPEMPGVVSWSTLAKVKQVETKDHRIIPEFTKEITALNDKEVKIQGFMMPLEPGVKQKHFLLSVNPGTCAYCMPAGPDGVVEVTSKIPVKYSYEPVVVSGKMAVLKNDPTGLFYRMTEAAPVSGK